MRCYLHYQPGRDNNVPDLRRAGRHRRAVDHRPEASEDAPRWMRDYFRRPAPLPRRHARTGARKRSELAVRAVPRLALAPVERRFHRGSRARALPRARSVWKPSRNWCCGCFEFVARHGIRPSLEAERAHRSALATSCARTSPSRSRCGRRCSRSSRCPTRRWRCAPCTKPEC